MAVDSSRLSRTKRLVLWLTYILLSINFSTQIPKNSGAEYSTEDKTNLVFLSLTIATKDNGYSTIRRSQGRRGNTFMAKRIRHTTNGTKYFPNKPVSLIREISTVILDPVRKQLSNFHAKIVVRACEAIKTPFCAASAISGHTLNACLCPSAGFQYYLQNPDMDWTCSLCSLPMRPL